MSLTHIGITLLLVVLLGIGAISCLMASIVVVPAWHATRWNVRAPYPVLPFGRVIEKALR